MMDSDVIVAGAGPAGLMLAAELRLAGAEVIVLEERSDAAAESRGMGFTARTLEVFDQRGLLPRFGDLRRSPGGHFGSVPIDFAAGDGSHASVSGIPQSRTVEILGDWATELGADIRRGHRLTNFIDAGDYVEAEVAGPAGHRVLRAPFLVGCDGGRSLVRRAGGFAFPGTDATAELLLADVRGIDQQELRSGERRPGGMLLAAPLGDEVMRIVVSEHGREPRRRTGPPTFAEVAEAWRRVSGNDISGAVPLWVSAFTDAARQAAQYRRGRVLLAGDAAHIHLPASGQGMNVSIQDAVNLGWKLGAVVTGRAGDDLLDTYHDERHPVGQSLLRNTQAQAVLFLGGPEMQPLRDILAQVFRTEPAARYLAGLVSGLDIRYFGSEADHPLLGRRLPPLDLLLPGGGKCTSTELLHEARGVVLVLEDRPDVTAAADGWGDRVDVVAAQVPDSAWHDPVRGVDALLVRPDGYVAWTSADGDLSTALSRYFGAPRKAAGERR